MGELDVSEAAKYQQISDGNDILKPGWRRQTPCPLIQWELLKGKTVIDLACNNGMMSIQAKQAGASRVVGVDFGEMIPFAKRAAKHVGVDVEFWYKDIQSTDFINRCPEFDFVFCCSVFRYMKDKTRFLTFLERITKDTMWLETNHKDLSKPVYKQIRQHTSFDGVNELGQSDGVANAEGHFMIRCKKLVQWRHLPITFIPIDLLKLTHDIEGFKDISQYPTGTYERMVAYITPLAGDITRYGLKSPLFVREFKEGENKGMFRIVEGHKRTFALQMNKKEGVGDYDAQCKIMPQMPSDWIREHGYCPEDYEGLIF